MGVGLKLPQSSPPGWSLNFLAPFCLSPILRAADWASHDQLTPAQPIGGLASVLCKKGELGHQIPSSGI